MLKIETLKLRSYKKEKKNHFQVNYRPIVFPLSLNYNDYHSLLTDLNA